MQCVSGLLNLRKYVTSQMANNPRFEKQTVSDTDTRKKHALKVAKAGVPNNKFNTLHF